MNEANIESSFDYSNMDINSQNTTIYNILDEKEEKKLKEKKIDLNKLEEKITINLRTQLALFEIYSYLNGKKFYLKSSQKNIIKYKNWFKYI